MFRITESLVKRYRAWERPAQLAVALALVLLVIVLVFGSIAPPEMRTTAIIGVIGLLFVLQFVVLWANRDLVTPYTQAQRRYLRGEFGAARDLLESQRADADTKALTLLGNTYRQLGRLDDSEAALREALAKSPDDEFPLYGLGRTLLAQGHYTGAASAIEAALGAGAPPVVNVDLGEALYRAGQLERALDILKPLDTAAYEPYRALTVAYLLFRLDAAEAPPPALIAAGLPDLRVAAERFAHTPYGRALADDVQAIAAMGHPYRDC